jgi:hypothetical protein
MNQFKKRLDVLEQTARPRRFPDMTAGLMLSYATSEERAEWAAAGRPMVDWATWVDILDQVYAD